MKNKEISSDEDGLPESDIFDKDDETRPKKFFDRNTVFLVIIFSLTFFILGNATGFFLLDKSGRSRQTDADFYVASSNVKDNPMTNDINGTGKGIQSGESMVDTTVDASTAEMSGQTSKPPDSAEENSTAQKDTGGKNEQTKADNRPTENNNTAVTQSENHTNGTRVYVTPSGKKYHLSASCGGDNSYETTLEEALSEGKTPCKKCAQ